MFFSCLNKTIVLILNKCVDSQCFIFDIQYPIIPTPIDELFSSFSFQVCTI